MTERRTHWVDTLKAFSILAVVVGHIATPLTGPIFAWHMPLFFFIAGFFLKPSGFSSSSFLKDLRRLMVPFVVFGLIGILAEFTKRHFFPGYSFIVSNVNLRQELIGTFYWMDMSHMEHYGFVLWFLPALLWGRTAAHWLIKLTSPLLAVAIAAVVFGLTVWLPITLPLAIDKGLIGLIWIVLGYYFFSYYQALTITPAKRGLAVSVLLVLLALLPLPLLNLATKTFSAPAYNLLYSLIVIGLAVLITSFFQRPAPKPIRLWGLNTLTVFIIHPYTNNVGYLISQKLAGGAWELTLLISIILLYIVIVLKDYGWKKLRHTDLARYLQSA